MPQVVFAPEAKSNRLKIVAGEVALDGTNPTPVDLSAVFRTAIVAVSLTIKGTTALGDNTTILWYNIVGTRVDIYGGKNTGGTDPTIVDATGTETVTYVAVGY